MPVYDPAFFALQIGFAGRVAAIRGLPLARALGEYTNLYVRLGCGDRLDPEEPRWRASVAALIEAKDPAAWVGERQVAVRTGPFDDLTCGCFRLSRLDPVRFRLHFVPEAERAGSPLAPAAVARRRAELHELAVRAAAAASGEAVVIGASWLYHLPAYRRLFPAAYLAGLRPMPHPYQRMPLWGQFLQRDGRLRSSIGERFRASVARARTMGELDRGFPLSVLTTTESLNRLIDDVASSATPDADTSSP